MDKWEKVRKHIYVSGRVQGVGFRYRTYYLAQGLSLTGWVRNLDDGRVEMELQGTEEAMNRLFKSLQSDSYIRIEDCQVEYLSVTDQRGFRVLG